MKNIFLYTLGITLLGMVVVGNAEAAPLPSWSQKLKCETSCPRFTVLKAWDNAAVLDKETGLVWERSPDENTNWNNAQTHCNNLQVSNRMGWRLPTLQELTTLIDASQTNPAIPSGHPFSNLQTHYWSASTSTSDSGWFMSIETGDGARSAKNINFSVWCVRGGSGVDNQ